MGLVRPCALCRHNTRIWTTDRYIYFLSSPISNIIGSITWNTVVTSLPLKVELGGRRVMHTANTVQLRILRMNTALRFCVNS